MNIAPCHPLRSLMCPDDAGVVGSHRLWDAIDNGAIPVFTDARQYLVLPFPNLWLAMSELLGSSDRTTLADALAAVVDRVKKRWSSLQHHLGIGRKIASWSTPGSRALDAYVKLLSMRMNVHHCDGLGHCVRPPCSKGCVWNVISQDSGCEENKDGYASFRFQKIQNLSLLQCFTACEKSDCRAVDYSVNKPNLPAGTCVLFRRACNKPVKRSTFGSVTSYRLKVAPPKNQNKKIQAIRAAKAACAARLKNLLPRGKRQMRPKSWSVYIRSKGPKKHCGQSDEDVFAETSLCRGKEISCHNIYRTEHTGAGYQRR